MNMVSNIGVNMPMIIGATAFSLSNTSVAYIPIDLNSFSVQWHSQDLADSNTWSKSIWDEDKEFTAFDIPFDPLFGIEINEIVRQRLLLHDRDLLPQICVIRTHLAQYFRRATLSLDCYADEWQNGHYSMIVYTEDKPQQALIALDAFEDNWWLEYVKETSSSISVDVSFI